MPIYPEPKPATTNGTPFRDSFADGIVNASLWAATVGFGTISESAGTLTMGSGTTANNVTSLLSTQVFHLPAKVAVGLSLSQRIANQTFFIELVSINDSGVPDGLELAGLVFDGTTVTQAKHQVRSGGLTANQSAASTYPSTGTPAKLFEIEASYDEVWFHGSAALDSAVGRVNSYRLQLKAPSPNTNYKLQLRWLNGATAPASNTNALVTFLSVIEYEELTTEVLGGRGTNAAGAAPSVLVAGGSAENPLPVVVLDGSGTGTALGLPTADAQTSVATSTTTVQLLAARTTRKRLLIFNPSGGAALSIGSATPVTTANTFVTIPAGNGVFMDQADFTGVAGAWYGLLASGTSTAQVRESY